MSPHPANNTFSNIKFPPQNSAIVKDYLFIIPAAAECRNPAQLFCEIPAFAQKDDAKPEWQHKKQTLKKSH